MITLPPGVALIMCTYIHTESNLCSMYTLAIRKWSLARYVLICCLAELDYNKNYAWQLVKREEIDLRPGCGDNALNFYKYI